MKDSPTCDADMLLYLRRLMKQVIASYEQLSLLDNSEGHEDMIADISDIIPYFYLDDWLEVVLD